MFAQLGTHIFQGLKAPMTWGETHAAKIGRIARINAKDALQKTGDELSEISLTVQYAAEFCTPAEEIEALKQSMQAGEVLPFISGEGDIWGNYIITGLDITNDVYTPAGVLIAATVGMKLLEYPEVVENPVPAGSALKSAAPAVEPPATRTPSTPAAGITADISEADNKVAQMRDNVEKVRKGALSVRRGVQNVAGLAGSAKQLYTNARTKAAATKKIISRAKDFPGSLDEAIGYAENLTKLSHTADLSVLEMNVQEMSDSAADVNKSAAPVIAFVATREGGE